MLDVGANEGQFANNARNRLPNAKIVSFEPIPEAYNVLCQRFKDDNNFQAFNIGFGHRKEKRSFLQNSFSPVSSILEFLPSQKEFYPRTKDSTTIEISLHRLDEFIQNLEVESNVLLKIDVQGFEDKVLQGASSILDRIKVIYIECSFMKFYKGQPLFDDIYEFLLEKGFSFRGVADQLNAGVIDEPTQIDAVFIKD